MGVPKSTRSRPDRIVCPECEAGELPIKLYSLGVPQCDSCGQTFERAIFKTLKQIATLGEALGENSCEECGHPEMHRLSDGAFICPACRSEMLLPNVSDFSHYEPFKKKPIDARNLEVGGKSVLGRLLRWIMSSGEYDAKELRSSERESHLLSKKELPTNEREEKQS